MKVVRVEDCKGSMASQLLAERRVLTELAEQPHALLASACCCFRSSRHLHFVMAYLPGGTIAQLLRRMAWESLPEESARFYTAQLALALGALHERKILYLDLKLENVLVKDEATKRIKVADFGMAKDVGVSSVPTTKGMGTVAYMAPEVASGKHGAYDGAAVDVWSMGVMLYVMVVCNYPFGHDGVGGVSVHEIIRRSSCAEFRFPAHATLSAEIKDLITGMLTVDAQR